MPLRVLEWHSNKFSYLEISFSQNYGWFEWHAITLVANTGTFGSLQKCRNRA